MSAGVYPSFLTELFHVVCEQLLTTVVFKRLVLQELHKAGSANSYMGSPGLVRS